MNNKKINNKQNFLQSPKIRLALAIILISIFVVVTQFPIVGQFIWPFSLERNEPTDSSIFSFFRFMNPSDSPPPQSSSARVGGNRQQDGIYVFPPGNGPANGDPGVSSTVPRGQLADVNSPCAPSFNDACKAAKATAQTTSSAACITTCQAAGCATGELTCRCPPELALITPNKDGTCTVSVQAVCDCWCLNCPAGTELPRGRRN